MKPTEHPVFTWQWQSVREVERRRLAQAKQLKAVVCHAAIGAAFVLGCIALGVLIGLSIWPLFL